jgi:hypothetical protein
MHQARVSTQPIADHPRSYRANDPAVRVDDTETYQLQAAVGELNALLLHERQRQVADARALLVELYDRDGVQVEDADLDAQAEDVARLERGDRFLDELATELHPDAALLGLAGQLDEHGLGVWREAAASLFDDCPPTLARFRWRVEEVQRGELRGHAQLVRTEAQLRLQLGQLGVAGRLWRRRRVAELRSQLGNCCTRREWSQRRLAYLDAKLQVIEATTQARTAWIAGAREVLVRGVVAAQVLADREHHRHQHNQGLVGARRPSSPGEGR